jgi:hypothetical protein
MLPAQACPDLTPALSTANPKPVDRAAWQAVGRPRLPATAIPARTVPARPVRRSAGTPLTSALKAAWPATAAGARHRADPVMALDPTGR